jgi:hypothetical protein
MRVEDGSGVEKGKGKKMGDTPNEPLERINVDHVTLRGPIIKETV